jgi:peptidyl-prolyl cis-trans isomerase D
MSEQQYEATLRREIARSDLTGAVADGAVAPGTLVEALYRMRNEKRTAETALLPETSVPEPADPGEAELAAWYEQHQDFFRVPEYRALSLVTLRLDEIAQRIEVAEDKLREEYQARLVEFSTPEHRAIDQIVVSDEAKAKEAASEIAGGKDFLEIAKSVAGLEPDAVHLGTMTREELPPVVADAAFALDEGKVSEPISGPFGWHILRVTAIEPGKVEPFESVRDRLALELAREQARDRTWELSNQLDDALAGGGTIEEAAKQLELPMMTIAAIDPDGRDPGGKPVELPLAPAELLRTAFNTPQGQATRLTETRDGGFYVLRVDGVTPSSVKPLAEVKERATQLWKSEKRNEAVAAKAKALAEQVTGEKTLSGVGVAENLAATTTPPFSRNGAEAGLSPALASRLFAAKPGEVVTVPGESGVWIAQLKTIERPEGKPGEVGFEQLSRQLQDAMRNDLVAAFDRALRSRYPVEIRREELARFF